MIVVVLILVILILSIILAFQFGRKSVPTPVGVTKTPIEGKQEVTSPITENAQSIETVPPEDKGTCELSGNWAMSDKCNADGTAIFTQAYKESKPGACPEDQKADIRPCCYQKGDWKDTTPCKTNGRKVQTQTTVNCAENFKTREVDCEYVGPWTQIGSCSSDGKQYYTRATVNSSESKSKSDNCCYISAWGGWTGWSNCNGSSKSRSRSRIVVNCPAGTPTSESQTQSCSIPISSYFTATCADLGGGSDVISASNLDDCMRKCKNNTHGHGYTCYGLIHGPGFCRVYNNKGLDHSTNICNDGLKTYTLN